MGCSVDGGEDFDTGVGIELMPVKAEKEAFANRLHRRLRIVRPQGGFHDLRVEPLATTGTSRHAACHRAEPEAKGLSLGNIVDSAIRFLDCNDRRA